jgi:hypothetical protein
MMNPAKGRIKARPSFPHGGGGLSGPLRERREPAPNGVVSR